jgi:hypothetical protein
MGHAVRRQLWDGNQLAKIDVGVKSNLNATAAPIATDDSTQGYGIGSTWKYSNVTYLCTDATKDKAVWVAQNDITYVDTWAAAVALISQDGTTYVNKFIVVSNANGGPSSGVTYTAPDALTDYIADGGMATYKVLAQGDSYSVHCQTRTITNPIITSVMLISGEKPTDRGYYIFTVTPTGGLPVGKLNDVLCFDGAEWSVWQEYTAATTVLVATNATGITQVTWRKFAGTWMSTADEYIPDGKEYQTGKLWNGKAVYRKCGSGVTGSDYSAGTYTSTGLTVPDKNKVLLMLGCLTRADGVRMSFNYVPDGVNFYVDDSLELRMAIRNTMFTNAGYLVWVEYTKS